MILTEPLFLSTVATVTAVGFVYASSRKASVASITSGLSKTVAKLERHAARKDADSDRHKIRVDLHFRRHEAAVIESAAATKVAGNIRTLLGDTK